MNYCVSPELAGVIEYCEEYQWRDELSYVIPAAFVAFAGHPHHMGVKLCVIVGRYGKVSDTILSCFLPADFRGCFS